MATFSLIPLKEIKNKERVKKKLYNEYYFSQDTSGQDQDRLSLEGQSQDSSQETLVSMHVHVLPPWLQAHGAPHFG